MTVAGGVQISTAIPDPFGNTTKGVIAFNGLNQNRCVTNSSIDFVYGTGDYTIEGWFYFLGLPVSNMRLWNHLTDIDNVDLASNNRIAYYNGSSQTFSANNAVIGNAWQHVALVRSSGTARIYVNGVSVVTQATTPNTTVSTTVGVGGAD